MRRHLPPAPVLRGTAVLAAAVLLVAGCSDSDSSRPAPSSTPSQAGPGPATPEPSGSPSPGPTGSPSPTSPSGPSNPGKPVWSSVLRQPVDGQHVVTQQRKYLVTRGSDEAGTTTVTDRGNRRVVVRHAPPAGFVAQSPVVIDDRWALVEEIRSDGPDPQIRAYRYDLTTGARTDLSRQRGLPPISEPEIGASGGTFAYSSTGADGRSCLVVAALDTLAARKVSCVADPGYVAEPVVSADAVTFAQLTSPQTARRCKRLFTAPLSGGPARPVAAGQDCIQWSGATLRDATVWSEVGADDPDQYQSKAYLRESGQAKARPLGPVVTDTIVACGNWIHWQTRTLRAGTETYQLHRWQPGRSAPEVIYSGRPGTTVTAPSCQDGTLLIETAHLGSGPKYTETLQTSAG